MGSSIIGAVVFYGLAALAVAGAAWVAFSRNIVRSAFALLATFLGVAGLYACLSADLVAVIQLMVYVGGVLVVILFAVMLTARIADVHISNQSLGAGAALFVVVPLTAALCFAALGVPDTPPSPTALAPTTPGIGEALLSTYVVPFEAVSMLLLAALLGAVLMARGWGVLPRRRAGAK